VKDDQRLSAKESGADRRESRGSISGQGFAELLIEGNQKPNAHGKGRPHGLAQVTPCIGVPLTTQLGRGAKALF
jgi:hypothetical protein